MTWHKTLTQQMAENRPWPQFSLPTRRQWVIAAVVLGICLQFADMGLDLREAFASKHASAAGLIGVGDFLFGCLAAVLLRR